MMTNNIEKSTKSIKSATIEALAQMNKDYHQSWTYGENWSNVNTNFETFINKYLFPKIQETHIINIALGNRFNWLAQEIDFIGQYSEEYVILDTVPIAMNLSKSEELMLKRNYPSMATKLYGSGIVKKVKFTLNNNDTRLNFQTLADATTYALGVYKKKISDINVLEEREMKAMLVDYSLSNTQTVHTVTSEADLFSKVFESILNIQNNSDKYNESNTASGGAIGRYTTQTNLNDVIILTNDKMKTYLLDTKLANTFQVSGIDLSQKIISFDDLGGVYKAKKDITLTKIQVDYLKTFGDYQAETGDIIPKNSVITYQPHPTMLLDFDEIKPKSELYAYIIDINKIRYRRNTNGMLKQPFYNGEYDEITHWIHYYSFKAISPFYNNILVTGV